VGILDEKETTNTIDNIDNDDGMAKLKEAIKDDFEGLCFLNLVDFDSKYGHRRDPQGYGDALERLDSQIPNILKQLKDDDLLMITADQGNDPVHHRTYHTRECVLLIVHFKGIDTGEELPLRQTFADIGATISDNFSVKMPTYGTSFLNSIVKKD